MSVERREVKLFRHKLLCDNCSAEMNSRDTVLMSHPPKYQYVCPVCGSTHEDTVLYPTQVFEYVDKENEKDSGT